VAPPALPLPVKSTATAGTSKVSAPAVPTTKAAPTAQHQQPIALPGAAEIAARNNPLPKSSPDDAAKPESMTTSKDEKEKSVKAAEAVKAEAKPEHSSAPASAIVAGTATPADKQAEKEEEEGTAAADKPKHEEHLSVPASALQSGTATPSEESEDTEDDSETSKTAVSPQASSSAATHAGSDVKDAAVESAPNAEKVEKVEHAEGVKKSTAFRESFIKESPASSSSASIASLAERVQAMQVGDGKNVGEQEAGKGEDAVKSVED
jgi:hypothetical protein